MKSQGGKAHNNKPVIFLAIDPAARHRTVRQVSSSALSSLFPSPGRTEGECKCTFRSLLLVELIMNLWRKLQKKNGKILGSMLTMGWRGRDARMQRDKCPFVGSRNSTSRYKCTSYSCFLLFAPFQLLNFPWNDTYIHVEVYEARGARSWCPYTLAAFNMGACYCAFGVLAGDPTTLFQGLALSEIPMD